MMNKQKVGTGPIDKIIWELPLKTISESNSSEHWTKSSKRHRQQQFFIRCLFNKEAQEIPMPCEITLIRISSKFLDAEENLPMAFKWIKDEIGACLFPEKVVTFHKKNGKIVKNKGHADSDPRVKWKYAQEKGKIAGIRIEIRSLGEYDLVDVEPLHIAHG